MQHGLAEWQTFLIDKPLPILMRTKLDVQDLIDQHQLSITQYASPILFDACFSACIFKHVNTQRIKAGRNPLTTLENALSHLGQEAFQNVLNRTAILEELNLPPENLQGYMRVMGQSCHAALQAKSWGEQRNVVQFEEIQLAALLQNITELMLWCYAENTMSEIEQACYVDKQTYEEAANKVLGCGMRELSVVLAEKWGFPEMAVDALNSKLDDFTLATGAALASELARVVDISWYSREAENLIEKISKYKGKKSGEIERRLHLNAVNMSTILLDKNYKAPARLLPQLADENYIDPQFVIREDAESVAKKSVNIEAIKARVASIKKTIAEKNPAEKSKHKLNVAKPPRLSVELAKSIQVFKGMVAQGKSTAELIEYAVSAILRCGVERCVFLSKVADKHVLISCYMSQISDDIKIKKMQIPVNTPHLFSSLIEKPRNVFINDANRSKYWDLIPEAVKLVIGVEQFFAMSIFDNLHLLGLMYADKVKGELTAEEFTQFQVICRLLSKAIVESVKNRKSPAS